jgi:hypothetical protein
MILALSHPDGEPSGLEEDPATGTKDGENMVLFSKQYWQLFFQVFFCELFGKFGKIVLSQIVPS